MNNIDKLFDELDKILTENKDKHLESVKNEISEIIKSLNK